MSFKFVLVYILRIHQIYIHFSKNIELEESMDQQEHSFHLHHLSIQMHILKQL